MKKKPLLIALGMMMLGTIAFAQSGLERIVVEKYYVSNAADAASADADLSSNLYPTGTLPAGSVTWRIYADLAPGWGVQVVYGENGRPVVLSSSTNFFNHPNGSVTGVPVPSLLGLGTGMLDSYMTIGAVSGSNRFGVTKDEDNATGGANISFTAGILANNDPSAGLPLTTADGVYNSGGSPAQLGIQRLGDAAGTAANIFSDGAVTGGSFNSTNSVWGVLGEQQGPLTSNRVLIGQFTTNGIFTYALNIQLRNASTAAIERYVYANPSAGDFVFPSLAGVVNAPTAYVIPSTAGVRTTPLLTVGQAALNGYRLVGIPDGMGGFDNGDGTYTILMNHEIGNTLGVNRAHGAKGAFVSKWTINKSNNLVTSGTDLIQDLFIWNGTTYIDSAYAIGRLCSGDLPATSAFYNALNGMGTQNRIFMSGEETGAEGKVFAHIVTGTDGGKSYELPYLGKFSWENAVARPYFSNKTLVIGTDDATPGQVYVYIGTKQNSGNDIQRAGLTNGKLYGIAVSGLTAEVNASFPAPNTAFSMVDLGFVNNLTGAALNTASNNAGVTNFLRPEDAVFDPRNPNVFYFVTTNSFSANSRLWKVEFNDVNNPELGGKITVLLEGGEGHKMLDNMTMDAYGNILLQEDPGNQSHIAKVWQYNTASDQLKLLAEHDSAYFVTGGSKFLTQDEESSGIFDASAFLGPGQFIMNVQAHYSISGELVEGGQLLTLYNPDTYLAESKGPSSSQTPYITPSGPGVKTKAILTVGDSASNGYKLVGIPDGMGAYDNGNGTFTLLVNHELGNTAGITRAHGAAGSFVSKWTFNKSTLAAVSGSDLIQDLFIWNGSSYVDSAYAIARLCSGDLPATSAFYNSTNGNGTTNRIYMNGEETGAEGKAFAHIVTGPDAGKSYQLPYLGKFSWENAVASPKMAQKTVVIGTDDATPGQVYVYVGNKTNTGNDIDRAGLNNGKLYGVRAIGYAANANQESNSFVPAPNSSFSLVDLGFVNNLTGAQLDANSTTAGVTRFLRPEDGHFDPSNPNDFYFVTTNSFTANSRLWRLRFNDITNPESGGTLVALLEGAEGQKMLDNMTIDNYGNVLLQEDPGNQSYLARLWNYKISTDVLSEIAVHDSARFVTGGSLFLTQDEESSGIIDASGILGTGNFLINTQSHYTIPGELVEGGQLLVMYNPATAASCVPTASTTTQTACGSFLWNGTTYTASGTYVFNTMNAAGCDSIATLVLTITNGPVWYADADGDTYGNLSATINACTQPAGYVANSNDCNDNSAAVNPLATEICNGIDDNCNGLTDTADPLYQGLAAPGAIQGNLSACLPASNGSTVFSVPAVSGATAYNWSVPTGLSITSGQGTNSITVSWTSASVGAVIFGNVSVTASNVCGNSPTTSAQVQLATIAPVTPGSVSGPLRACPGDVLTFSVALVSRATSYNWTLPTGLTVTAGAGTNTITVSAGATFAGGTISVVAVNICGSSSPRTRSISLNLPNTPGLISGNTNGVCAQNGVSYAVAAISNATSYSWAVPSGAVISSGQGTNAIQVNFSGSYTSGQITVNSVNACGTSGTRSLTVSGTPARPASITGVVNPSCAGQSYTYGVPAVPGTSQYTWNVTPGGTVSFPAPLVTNGKDAQVAWGTGIPTSQGVQVSASNACGTSLSRSVNVTVNTCVRLADQETGFTVYPNPASGKVFISHNSAHDKLIVVSLFDAAGRTLETRRFNVQEGSNLFEIELNNYASGIYNLVMQSEEGKKVQRLIIE